ncbi:MAG: ricin-type beta-trefoil lectin domain protein [Lewinellaceae bacterium]|nr:ricin-type beta-trefoil lectin domain protein [Lewinellaceae bacterium]
MKKQIKRSNKNIWILPLLMIFLGMNITVSQAQKVITSGTYDVLVTSDYDEMYIALRGGDGGKNDQSKGGQGATVAGRLTFGSDSGKIPVGSTLRFLAGEAGESNSHGSGGGGASGLAFKAPGSSQWVVLAVAAGGGGACYNINIGLLKSTGADGGPGRTSIVDMKETQLSNYEGYQGGGLIKGSTDPCGGQPGMVNGSPEQVAVGSGCDVKGGAGFGSGASRQAGSGNADSKTYYGGGGGGYYGGYIHYNSDGEATYDNGGGSYSNGTYLSSANANSYGTTNSPQDGYAMYTFEKEIKFAYNTNLCIEDINGGTDNGNNIQTNSCAGNKKQSWIIHPTDRTIHSKLNYGKCLDLTDGNTSNSANIQLWDCVSGNANQLWVYNGLYNTIHSSVNSDKCFDAANGSVSSSGVNLQLWDCQYSNYNQKWMIDGATTVNNPANMKHIIPVYAPSFAVHSHTGAESGSNIQLWTKDDTNTAEQWYFDGLAIKMRNTQNLCIDLNGSNTSNGSNIQLYNCNGTNAQKWIYDGMNKSIRSVVNPGKCMQIVENSDGAYGKRSNVEIQDCNGSVLQQFLIQE